MRKHTLRRIGLFVCLAVCSYAFEASAIPEAPAKPQNDYERSTEAVIRNKNFYKSGRLELSGVAGLMPYDSLINHYQVGGRLTWHLSDHYGWEILDAQVLFPSITSFTTGLVSEKGISNLQTPRLKMMFATNFLLSPIYGKFRFIGSSVLHFDAYLVAGFGLVNTETVRFGATAKGNPAVESIAYSGFSPMFDFGFGFKIFLNDAMGLLVDFRDYVTISPVYGVTTLKSNFSFFMGLTFFIPTFG